MSPRRQPSTAGALRPGAGRACDSEGLVVALIAVILVVAVTLLAALVVLVLNVALLVVTLLILSFLADVVCSIRDSVGGVLLGPVRRGDRATGRRCRRLIVLRSRTRRTDSEHEQPSGEGGRDELPVHRRSFRSEQRSG